MPGRDGKWQFPANIVAPQQRDCEAVYSFVLDAEHCMIIDGVECVTLGHNLTGDVVGHPYFGSQSVVEDLSKAEGWECGLVELRAGCLLRDDDTQLLAAFDLTREVARPIGVAA